MNRRALLSLPFLFTFRPAWAALSSQDLSDLGRVEAYLNSMRTLKAQFVQVAPDGDTSTGTAWIDRPGKLRFQYDPPSPYLLIAGYGVGFFIDRKLPQVSNFIPSTTPIGILVADRISFTDGLTVDSIRRQGGLIAVTLYRTASPGEGQLILSFSDAPLVLRQWTVIDGQHKATTVRLSNLTVGGTFDPSLVQFTDPKLMPRGDQRGG